MNVTVVVATYGSDQWRETGDRAADAITAVPVIRVHQRGSTLARVRNAGLAQVRTEHVCFVDGDDGLEDGYFDRALDTDVIVTPLDGRFPVVNTHGHECEPACLTRGNYIHIGAIARTGLIRSLGGFREYPIYEDWDLWLRCRRAGASFVNSPGPSYLTRLHGTGGRNTGYTAAFRRNTRSRILRGAVI